MSAESKVRSFLFREALHINKCLLNKPFPRHYPSCLPAGSVECLFAWLPSSLGLSHPPSWAVALKLFCHVGFAVAMQNSCLQLCPLSHLSRQTLCCQKGRRAHMVTALVRFAVELIVPAQNGSTPLWDNLNLSTWAQLCNLGMSPRGGIGDH